MMEIVGPKIRGRNKKLAKEAKAAANLKMVTPSLVEDTSLVD